MLVVICFHFTIFVVLETTRDRTQANAPEVVICFHFTIFVVLETTYWNRSSLRGTLWFAFILLSLSYWKQPNTVFMSPSDGCDLLSFYYLCRTGNNRDPQQTLRLPVVICFHFTIFVVLETTHGGRSIAEPPLWFAFILLSLSYWKQRNWGYPIQLFCCDLLSFYYLCRTGNNVLPPLLPPTMVVICFHFTIFVVLETTKMNEQRSAVTLWFAFILLSLSYWKQLLLLRDAHGGGCDLLSFYYLCRTGNNRRPHHPLAAGVVICFHFTIFVVLETTEEYYGEERAKLWFAFILLSLSYWKQQRKCLPFLMPSCDLLSFYYLCRTGNNIRRKGHVFQVVVICFHFTIFVVLETTHHLHGGTLRELWFAFILLSLSYWKQLPFSYKSLASCCDLLSFYYLCRTGNN